MRKVDSEPPQARALARMYEARARNARATSTAARMDFSGRWIARRRRCTHVHRVDDSVEKTDSMRRGFWRRRNDGETQRESAGAASVHGSGRRRCIHYEEVGLVLELAQRVPVRRDTRCMSKGKTPREDGTYWVYENHWAGLGRSAPGWNAESISVKKICAAPRLIALRIRINPLLCLPAPLAPLAALVLASRDIPIQASAAQH
ncbi:hypothetical protein B0H13DRAFT_2274058 [Mycena leptocephala]|nr:hypothetical protein B0H13DRAFT_2274058 [Mycena leptocephala]